MKKLNTVLSAALLGAALLFSGCGAVTPDLMKARNASPGNGGALTSGVTSIPSKGKTGPIEVEADFVTDYNGLIDLYGNQFAPALKHNDGITVNPDGTVSIDRKHFRFYGEMVQWDNARITF